MADLIERKALKLLAQAGQVLNQMVSEGLCDEPQKELMQTSWRNCAACWMSSVNSPAGRAQGEEVQLIRKSKPKKQLKNAR